VEVVVAGSWGLPGSAPRLFVAGAVPLPRAGRPQQRALTNRELQDLFDYADDQVTAARTSGRKGWLTMLRDATAFKVAYAWGLRRREVVMLDLPAGELQPRDSRPSTHRLEQFGLPANAY
jgi:integrase